ncbi:MAG: phosphatase PAP2 family protein [Gammaproteobacteria bacterium]|nr:phosphatase PAP2 family protein [Gammaproteobacteria bacterium]
MNNIPISHTWRPIPLIVATGCSFLLFCSWWFEPGRALWMRADNAFFWAFNQSLGGNETWAWFWAITNNRLFDLVAAGFLAGVILVFILRTRKTQPDWAVTLARFVIILLLTLIMVQLGKTIPIDRPSPTTIYPEALRLSELVPEASPKDISGDSFPGDHGLVLFIVAGGIWIYLSPAYGIVATLGALFFVLPRLASGAHWLSDELVGAVMLGILGLSWYVFTPARSLAERKLVIPLAGKIRGLLPGRTGE